MYGPALARIHADAFADTFRPGFDWLVDVLYAETARPRLFDLGCGDGTWLDHARYRGIPGAGIDASEPFVQLALMRKLAVSIGDAARPLIPPGTTAVTALGEVLAYDPASLARAVPAAAAALPVTGVLVFDLPGPGTPDSTARRSGPGWTLTSRTRVDGARLTREITINTGGPAPLSETHRQRLFAPEDVMTLLTRHGFSAEIMDSYGPCPMLPGRFAALARKLA